jgi:CRISPR-associated protein Cas8b1/Cst1 subtype I-B
LKSNQIDACIVIGVECPLVPIYFMNFDKMRILSKKNNQPQKAAAICDQLLKNDEVKKDVHLKSKLGVVLTEIHRNDLAFQLLNEVLAEKEDDAAAWNYIGIIHLRRGKFNEAEKAFQESIKLDAKIAKTFNNLGTLYLTMFLKNRTQQLHNQALTAFNKALEIDSKLVSALNGRASAFKFVKRIREALRDWKQVIKIKPDFTDGYFNIAITLLQTGRKKEALTYLKICQEKYNEKLTPRDRERLIRLIQAASS